MRHIKDYTKSSKIVSHEITMGGKDEVKNEGEAIGNNSNSAKVVRRPRRKRKE